MRRLVALWAATAAADCGCENIDSTFGVEAMVRRGFVAAARHRAPPDLAARLSARGARGDRAALMAPVLAELSRSLRAHRASRVASAEAAARELRAATVRPDAWVLVYDGRVYVDERFPKHSKHHGHATMVKGAADLVGLPNALYALSVDTRGPPGCGAQPLTLAVNKELGYEQCGVLIPNTYFGGEKGNLTQWAREVAAAAADTPPFADRAPRALYRGSLNQMRFGDDVKLCATKGFGNYARLGAIAASREAPARVDAALAWTHDACKGGCRVPEPECASVVDDWTGGMVPGTVVNGSYLSYRDYRRHKYLLNLPGAKSGSYSKNLNHLWRTGAVVLQWVAPFVEWYYPALVDRETHVAVARHSVADTVAALEANPAAAEAIGRAGREIHDVFLCPRCLAEYLRTTLEAVRDHLGWRLVLDDPPAAAAFFRAHLACDRVLEVIDDHDHPWRKLAAADPAHPCRAGGPRPDPDRRRRDHARAVDRLRRAEAGLIPVDKQTRKFVGARART